MNTNFFIFNKNNWREQKSLFYGYKTLDDNGFWLEIKNDDNQLTLKGSYIQPIVAVYNKDNYWAVSNSVKLLEQHLLDNNITLTKNEKCCLFNTGFFEGYTIEDYKETDTIWNEIQLTPNFSYLVINNDNLEIHKIDNKLLSIPLKGYRSKLDSWYIDWKNYFSNLTSSSSIVQGQLSGGVDSRVLFTMWKDIELTNVIANWNKSDNNLKTTKVYNFHFNCKGITTYASVADGLISNYVLFRFSEANKDKINLNIYSALINRNNKFKKLTKEEADEMDKTLVDNLFYSVGIYKKDWIKGIKQNYDFLENYVISGVGTESIKVYPGEARKNFILGTLRRYFIPKFLYNYFTRNTRTILPFLDKRLLELHPVESEYFMYFLIYFYNPELLNIPFNKDNSVYLPTMDDSLEDIMSNLMTQINGVD